MSDDLKAFLSDRSSDQFRYFRGHVALGASSGLGPRSLSVQQESARKMKQLRSAQLEASLALARAEAQIKDEEISAVLRMNDALDVDQAERRRTTSKDAADLVEAIHAAAVRIAIAQSNLEGWQRTASARPLAKEEKRFLADWSSKLDAAKSLKAKLEMNAKTPNSEGRATR